MSLFEPPSGLSFFTETMMPHSILFRDLCRIVAFLQEEDPQDVLQLFDDLWQVDGHHFTRGHLDFPGLYELIATPGSVYPSAPAMTAARIGVAPLDGDWYLRFLVSWDVDGDALEGCFDLTLSETTARRFCHEVLPQLEQSLQSMQAKRYFDDVHPFVQDWFTDMGVAFQE